MANINIDRSVSVDITTEEIETLKKAYAILHEIEAELWNEDGGDDTETFGTTSTACDCLRQFLLDDCGVDVKNM